MYRSPHGRKRAPLRPATSSTRGRFPRLSGTDMPAALTHGTTKSRPSRTRAFSTISVAAATPAISRAWTPPIASAVAPGLSPLRR